jgi:hypothetical protein
MELPLLDPVPVDKASDLIQLMSVFMNSNLLKQGSEEGIKERKKVVVCEGLVKEGRHKRKKESSYW